jgi:hypothetical protein
MASTNPLSIGYGALTSALNAWPAFTSLVRPGSETQVNMQASGFQPPKSMSTADFPSVELRQGRFFGRPYQRNSKSIEMQSRYPLMIRSGSSVIDRIDLIDTVVIQALMSADGSFPGTLGLPLLITKWELTPANHQMRTGKRPDWMIVLNVDLTMVLTRSVFLTTGYT